jgi:hypothetical protein
MRNFGRRLGRLEARLTDGSGCAPYSAEWFAYWTSQTERLLAGENVAKPPITFFDAILASEPPSTKLHEVARPSMSAAIKANATEVCE